MSHDLSLAQSHAFQLSPDLMVPVTVFAVDGEYGVLPSDEIDDCDDLGSDAGAGESFAGFTNCQPRPCRLCSSRRT